VVIELTVKNDNVVHSIDDLDEEEDHSLNHCALSHASYLNSRKQSNSGVIDSFRNESNWREHSFKAIIPRKLSEDSDSDLRLMRVSLKNAIAAASVHLERVERELKKRGSSLKIINRDTDLA